MWLQVECSYTLYAVVVHSGFAMCGHYTAFVRHDVTQRWYYADDSRVKKVHLTESVQFGGGRKRIFPHQS